MALLFATSCKKDQNAPEDITVGEGEFLATIDNGANPQNAPVVKDGMSTMTTINSERFVIWEAGDQISVNNLLYTTDTEGNTVKFMLLPSEQQPQNPASVEETGYFAFYLSTITKANQVLQATQTIEYDAQSKVRVGNLPMYAFSQNNQLTFHNICAALKVTVPAACNSIVVSADENIWGEFTLTQDGDNYKAEIDNNSANKGKSLTVLRSTGSFAANEVIYVAVPANTYTNFTIQCKDAQNHVVFAKVLEERTVDVNKVYNLTLSSQPTIPADCFRFTAQVVILQTIIPITTTSSSLLELV